MLVRALIVLVPVLALLAWSVTGFVRTRARVLLLPVGGACCLLIVVAAHVFEARHVFGVMGWGEPYSAGHYLDLTAAILGLTLIPVGYIMHLWGSRLVPPAKR